MMTELQSQNQDSAAEHYRTAGNGLMLLGAINIGVAAYAFIFGSENAYIGFDMMGLFAASFIGVGYWMRSQTGEE